MPDLSPWHREIVLPHVLGVFLFLLGHGVSAAVGAVTLLTWLMMFKPF